MPQKGRFGYSIPKTKERPSFPPHKGTKTEFHLLLLQGQQSFPNGNLPQIKVLYGTLTR